MDIQITWKEHGQAFAGVFNAEAVEAQFKEVVVRTVAGVNTIPYECITSAKANGDVVKGDFNQTKFAKEVLGIELPPDGPLFTVRLVLGKEVSKKLAIVGESALQVTKEEKAVFTVKFLDEAEAGDFSAEGATVEDNGTIVVDPVEEDTDVLVVLGEGGSSSGSGSNA